MGMTVAELIEVLQTADPDAIVVLATDAEANSYMELNDVDVDLVIDDDGEIGLGELTPDLEEAGFDEDDIVDGEDCVVLYP
jgi:hypothetical protein